MKEMFGEADGPIRESDKREEEAHRRRSETALDDDVLSYWSSRNRPTSAGANTIDGEIREFTHFFSLGMLDGFRYNYARVTYAPNPDQYLAKPPQLTEVQQKIYAKGMYLGTVMAQHNALGVAVLNLNEFENLEGRIVSIINEHQARRAINPVAM